MSKDTYYLLRDQSETDGSNRRRKIKSKGKTRRSKKAESIQILSVGKGLKILKDNFNGRGQRAPRRKLPTPARQHVLRVIKRGQASGGMM